MRRVFKLHHHKHTGKLIHHRHTSYWALVLLVVLAGGLVLFVDRTVHADTLNVTATVPAPIPSDPAVITAPSQGATLQTDSTIISGTCPVITPAVIIVIYKESDALGSAVCDASGEFSVTIPLQTGAQTLIARVLTITGQWGQDSAPLTLTYTPPSMAPSSRSSTASSSVVSQSGSLSSPLNSPLLIQLDAPLVAYRPGYNVSVHARFSGGIPPYRIVIEWGDGTSVSEMVHDNEYRSFSHTYNQKTQANDITISMTDSQDVSVVRHYAVVNLVPSSLNKSLTAAGILDLFAPTTLDLSLIACCTLLAGLLLLWRYELVHFRNRVGLPMHYPWQHKKMMHK